MNWPPKHKSWAWVTNSGKVFGDLRCLCVVSGTAERFADAIITFNLKDFPAEVLAKYGIEAIHPDEFVYCQIDLAPPIACAAIKKQRESLKNPPKAKEEFLTILQKQQLPQTVSALRAYIELI